MAFNICTVENGARIYRCSSQSSKQAQAENVLNDIKKLVWTTGEGLPQYLIVDLRQLKQRPRQIRWIGFDLWHDYQSNPKVVEVQIKQDDEGGENNFITWRSVTLERQTGMQFFALDPISSRFELIKILIKETYGASMTYLNQVMLYSENPMAHEVVPRVRTSTDHVSSRWKKDVKKSREKGSVHLSEQERISVPARLRYPDNEERDEMLSNQHTVQTDEKLEEEEEFAYEQEKLRDSLSGLVPSQRQSEDLNTLALLSHNMMGIEESLQGMFKKLEIMSHRLDETEKNQNEMEDRLTRKLKKYVDQQLELKLKPEAPVAPKKDKQIQRLIRQLNEKLVLREMKLSKLKSSR